MAVIRRHRALGRSVTSPFVLPSLLFVAAPWMFPSAIGLAAGLGAHLVWMAICELLAPARPNKSVASGQSARPVPVSSTPVAAPAFVSTTVLAVLDETHEIKTFRFARPEGFEFAAGQFVAVRLLIDGKPHVRCYSISSAPHTRGCIEISVRRQGLVSGTLHATIRPGSVLNVRRPAGHFVYPAGDERPLALIAGGVGITPLLSMLRHATESDPTRPVTLLYSARSERDVAFHNVLRVVAERHPSVRVAITLTRPDGDTRLRCGRLDASMVRQYVTAPAHTIFCLCGPGPMIADMRLALGAMGVPDNQVRYEQFDLAVAATEMNRATDSPVPVATGARDLRVTFETSGITVAARPSQSLLETAEAGGIGIASICRAGVCQSCRTRLISGTADCRSDVLDPEDRAAGFVLPCVTWPAGDCVLDA